MFPTLHPHSLVGYITILWFFKAPLAILKFILSPEIFIETKFLCKPQPPAPILLQNSQPQPSGQIIIIHYNLPRYITII